MASAHSIAYTNVIQKNLTDLLQLQKIRPLDSLFRIGERYCERRLARRGHVVHGVESIRETGTHFTTDMRRFEGLRKNTKVTYVINRENGAYTMILPYDTENR